MTAADDALEQAQLRLKLEDFAGAVTDYSAVLAQQPTPAAYYGRAMAYLSLGQGAAAAIDAQQALELRPQWPAALRLLGKARAQQRDWAGAIAAYEQAIAAYEQVAHETEAAAIAQCREQIRQWQKQPQQLRASAPPPIALPIAPAPVAGDPLGPTTASRPAPPTPPPLTSPDPIRQTYSQSVQRKIEQGELQAALEDVTWVLQLDPQDWEALAHRGVILGRLGRTKEAFADFERVLQQDSQRVQIYAERARLRLKLGDAWGTVQDCDRWLEQVPKAVIAWVLRARAKGQLQQWEQALADYDRAIALAPQQPDLQEGKGDLQAAQAAAASGPNAGSSAGPSAGSSAESGLEAAIATYRQAATLWLNRGDRANHDRLQAKIEQLQTPPAPDSFQVPIRARSGSSPILEVVFEDRITLEMVLDTGCTTTLLTAAQARALGVVATGRQYTRVADGRVVEMGTGRVRSIAVGGATVRDLEVLIGYDRGAEEGLLGQNFFCHFEMRIRTDTVEFIPIHRL